MALLLLHAYYNVQLFLENYSTNIISGMVDFIFRKAISSLENIFHKKLLKYITGVICKLLLEMSRKMGSSLDEFILPVSNSYTCYEK